MALPKSWMKGVHPKEESAPEIDHSAAAAAAQDLMDQLDTGASLDDLLDNGDSSDEVALKTREYNPVDPPYGQDPKYGQDPEPYRKEPKPYNPEPPTPYGQDPKPYNPEPPTPYGQQPKPYNPEPPTPYGQDPKPYGQDSTYGKDPYCRTYYDNVYDKKCKDYKDKVCYTT